MEAIEGIEVASAGKVLEDYDTDWLLRHGVQRGLEIISEAARRIPPPLCATRPEIPWAEIIGIGNVLRHDYHRVAGPVIWNVVLIHLTPLEAALLAIEADLHEGS